MIAGSHIKSNYPETGRSLALSYLPESDFVGQAWTVFVPPSAIAYVMKSRNAGLIHAEQIQREIDNLPAKKSGKNAERHLLSTWRQASTPAFVRAPVLRIARPVFRAAFI